jgi:hypothetical protein
LYNFYCAILHCFLEFFMSGAIVLSTDERLMVRKGLEALAAKTERSARAALDPAVAAIYDRNVASINALISKFA